MYSFWLFLVACILHLTSEQENNRTKRIIGGDFYRNLKRTPYLGFLIFKDKDNVTQGCGATILSPKFILTAGSCMKPCTSYPNPRTCYDISPSEFKFYTGSAVLYQNKIYRSNVSKWIIHSQYKTVNEVQQCANNHDIAIGVLTEPLKFGKYINKVELPKAIYIDQVNTSSNFDETPAELFGWGDVLGSGYDTSPFQGRRLKSLNVTLVNNSNCLDIHNTSNDFSSPDHFELCYMNEFLCSLDPSFKSGSCNYDKGGPLMINNTQIGVITSRNEKCVGKSNPAVYTRVDIHVKWIEYYMKDNS